MTFRTRCGRDFSTEFVFLSSARSLVRLRNATGQRATKHLLMRSWDRATRQRRTAPGAPAGEPKGETQVPAPTKCQAARPAGLTRGRHTSLLRA